MKKEEIMKRARMKMVFKQEKEKEQMYLQKMDDEELAKDAYK